MPPTPNDSLAALRIKSRPDLPNIEDSVPPPTLVVDPRFRTAFYDQARNMDQFNERMRTWWNEEMIRRSKE